MSLISIVTPCYNEQDNVRPLYEAVKAVFAELPHHRYEHIFIDNNSKDRTQELIRELVKADANVKAIFNSRNFGHFRSPYYGLLQARGDAAVLMASDFQDPPAMIRDFIQKWEEGYKMALGIKEDAEENRVFFLVRKLYYSLVARIADIQLYKNTTGFGLYDRKILDVLRSIDDPYPYFRGLICEVGFEAAKIPFKQPRRARGISSQNFYILYDAAMLGITSHSKLPFRVATMSGFVMSVFAFLLALGYLVAKLAFWNKFQLGTAPILIGLFFFGSVQLFFVGILGEYIGAIYTQILKRPLVVEKERLGF